MKFPLGFIGQDIQILVIASALMCASENFASSIIAISFEMQSRDQKLCMCSMV